MFEALKSLLLTLSIYFVAALLAGSLACILCWLLQEERRGWIRLTTALALFSFLIVYPAILLIQSIMDPDPLMPYDDNPYHENIYDRYS